MLTKTLISRGILLRGMKHAVDNIKQAKRHGHHGTWSYRAPPPQPSKKSVLIAEGLGALAWYWILYHIITEPEHLTGEWKYISPSTWTDEELGIPPDSAGVLKI